ncbi:hypothetical protein K0651_08305 [Ornithinimicrobium sp. Arc0846-15]|nr:hypothetical protein [Ornithinimicrobium laminariae]
MKGLPSVRSQIAKLVPGRSDLRADLKAERQRVSQLRKELRQAQAEAERDGIVAALESASFTRDLFALRRANAKLRGLDPEHVHPQRQLPVKLHNYSLAASHGVPTPQVYAVWGSPKKIDLRELPDRFVVKGDRGSNGRGVLPLTRVEDDLYELAGGKKRFTGAEVAKTLAAQKSVSGPYFAEEFLEQPQASTIPDDIKVYAFYGEIGQTLVKRVRAHGDSSTTTRQYFDDQGRVLGQVLKTARMEATLEPPVDYAEMMRIARHLSRAVGTSFIRVDLYQTDRGPVLGELTRTPGGTVPYEAEHDRLLGEMWEEARYRLELDLIRGRPVGRLTGGIDAPNYYPSTHFSHQNESRPWAKEPSTCDRWCGIDEEVP